MQRLPSLQSFKAGTAQRNTKQATVENYSSFTISTVTALSRSIVLHQTGGTLPLQETGLSYLPWPAGELGAAQCCHRYLVGRWVKERDSKQRAFLRKDVGDVVFWPLLTSLIQLCIKDILDPAVLAGGKSLCPFTLLKARAGKYQHGHIFFRFFQVHCWKV